MENGRNPDTDLTPIQGYRGSEHEFEAVSVCFCSVALAMPKTMPIGVATPARSVTGIFDGLMSRWMVMRATHVNRW